MEPIILSCRSVLFSFSEGYGALSEKQGALVFSPIWGMHNETIKRPINNND